MLQPPSTLGVLLIPVVVPCTAPSPTKRSRIGTPSLSCINAPRRTIHSVWFQPEAITLEKIIPCVNYRSFVSSKFGSFEFYLSRIKNVFGHSIFVSIVEYVLQDLFVRIYIGKWNRLNHFPKLVKIYSNYHIFFVS